MNHMYRNNYTDFELMYVQPGVHEQYSDEPCSQVSGEDVAAAIRSSRLR